MSANSMARAGCCNITFIKSNLGTRLIEMSSPLPVNDPNCHFEFDPWIYLEEYYGKIISWHRSPLNHLHKFFTSRFKEGADLKVLNFGNGPVVAFEASAVPYSREIVLAEYAAQNRAVAKLWLDQAANRPDFTALYKYVVEELEGRGPQEVEERQKAVRRLATLCSCDIFQDPPIQKGYEGPYDAVYTASTLEVACSNIEEYGTAVSKLTAMLKPGGWLLMNVSMGTANTMNVCYVGPTRFVELNISVDEMFAILQERCGFERDSITVIPQVPEEKDIPSKLKDANVEDMMFVMAQKKIV